MAGNDNARMAADLPPRRFHLEEERSAKWGKVPRFLAGVGQLFFLSFFLSLLGGGWRGRKEHLGVGGIIIKRLRFD